MGLAGYSCAWPNGTDADVRLRRRFQPSLGLRRNVVYAPDDYDDYLQELRDGAPQGVAGRGGAVPSAPAPRDPLAVTGGRVGIPRPREPVAVLTRLA